jgi:hypothetical protein
MDEIERLLSAASRMGGLDAIQPAIAKVSKMKVILAGIVLSPSVDPDRELDLS